MAIARVIFPQAPINTTGLSQSTIAELQEDQRFQLGVGLIAGGAPTPGLGYTWGYLAGYTFTNSTTSTTTWTVIT